MPSKLAAANRRLNAAREKRRRQELGPPLQGLDDAALTALAEVGPHSLAEAEALVRDAAGEAGVAMFRAKRSTT